MPTGIQFTETMRGHYSTAVVDDDANAEARGKHDGATFEFTVTVSSDNLGRMLTDSGQISHLELEYYEKYYKPEQDRHQAVHAATWGGR